CNLFLKQRDYAAVASQHIAKTHSDKIGPGMSCKHLNDHLTHALGSPHDVCRIYCFICRDEYKFLGAVPVRSFGSLESSEYIVFNRLVRAILHERNMLV